MDSRQVRLTPLGGLGEIGLNLMMLSVGDASFILDCGVQFPDASMLGAELVLPDLRFLERMGHRVAAIVLTHGHEDHIGAVPHVLKVLNVPVYGTPFTLGLVHEKLLEHGLAGTVDTTPVSPDSRITIAGVDFEFVRVTHSIPDCVSLVIRTPVGTIIHTGDWKIDRDPVDGRHFDRDRFEALGDEGVHLLLSDSTNAEVPGWNAGEREVSAAIEARVAAWPGRVLVTMFSSNLHRLAEVARIARATGRKLCLIGRSLQKYVRVAQDVGILPHDLGDLVDLRHLNDVAPGKLLVVLTGSQGEPRAALGQAALGEHRELRIGPGDLVLFSSRKIPGNERAIARMINNLSRRGARVVHGYGTGVHTSGHAARDELSEMLLLTRPRHFIPVHGEYSFLQRHAELAQELGIDSTLIVQDGDIVELTADGPRVAGKAELENFYLEADVTADAKDLDLGSRTKMAWNGVLAIFLRIERRREGLRVTPQVQATGLFTDHGRHLEACAKFLTSEMALLPAMTPARDISDSASILARRFWKRAVGKKPVVMVKIDEPTVESHA